MTVGARTGAAVGAELGINVGAELGIAVGAELGIRVGAQLGPAVGGKLGIAVGDGLGITVGAGVGTAVGDSEIVGLTLGERSTVPPSTQNVSSQGAPSQLNKSANVKESVASAVATATSKQPSLRHIQWSPTYPSDNVPDSRITLSSDVAFTTKVAPIHPSPSDDSRRSLNICAPSSQLGVGDGIGTAVGS